MKRRMVGLASAVLVLGGVLGCGEDDIFNNVTQATPLVEGFISRQKTADVESALRRAGLIITVLEEGSGNAPQSKARPALSIRVLRASPFRLWDLVGDLRLEFINEELASTWFYPRDPAQFRTELRRRGLSVDRSRPLRLGSTTELRTGVDFSGAEYWAWEDVLLRAAVERWIKQNA